MKVRDCLQRAPETVPPQCTCREAAALMRDSDVGALLVTEAGDLVGIVTDRDIATRLVACGRSEETSIGEVMTPLPVTVDGDEDVEVALRMFGTGGFRRLPVLEERELAGIVTVDDVLTGLVHRLEEAVHPVARDVG